MFCMFVCFSWIRLLVTLVGFLRPGLVSRVGRVCLRRCGRMSVSVLPVELALSVSLVGSCWINKHGRDQEDQGDQDDGTTKKAMKAINTNGLTIVAVSLAFLA